MLGVNGMLGSAVLSRVGEASEHDVTGTVRGSPSLDFLSPDLRARVVNQVDALNDGTLSQLILTTRPDVVINCIGLVKQRSSANDAVSAISINSLLPHKLAKLTAAVGARLVLVSTDCVFTGTRGNYRERDVADASDLYGRSKLLGEVDAPNAIVLRTSIVGPEIGSRYGLLEWFLSQTGAVKGFSRAIFSGVSTDELALLMLRHVLPRSDLHGVYHVGGPSISKYDLLRLFRDAYNLTTTIQCDEDFVIDRSLDSSRFRAETGYVPPDWTDMVKLMRRRHGLRPDRLGKN